MKHNNIIKLCLGIFLAFTMALPAIAQKTQTFKGVVVDTTGEPIIGASVKVVGTTTGTITDLPSGISISRFPALFQKFPTPLLDFSGFCHSQVTVISSNLIFQKVGVCTQQSVP